MTTIVKCAECGTQLTLRSAAVGDKIKCPKCKAPIRIEASKEAEAATRHKLAAGTEHGTPRAPVQKPLEEQSTVLKKGPAGITAAAPKRSQPAAVTAGPVPRRQEHPEGRAKTVQITAAAAESALTKAAGNNKLLTAGLSAACGVLIVALVLVMLPGGRKNEGTAPQAAAPALQVNPGITVPDAPPDKPPVNGPVNPPANNGALIPEVLAQVKAATALVKVELADGRPTTGSGFLEANSGLVLTNSHVVGMRTNNRLPRSIQVVFNSGEGAARERVFTASLASMDPRSDLALLRLFTQPGVDRPLPTGLTIDPTTELVETQKVYVFGFPLSTQVTTNKGNPAITVSESSISSLRKGPDDRLTQIQVNSGINPGNSGGPVVDAQGRVIGVAVAMIKGTQTNFAIPTGHVQTVLDGSVSGVSTDEPFQRDNQVVIKVNVRTNDALQRIKRVSLDWWIGDPGLQVPAALSQPTVGVRQNVLMQYMPGKQEAQGEIQMPIAPPNGKVLWVQPTYLAGDNQTRWLEGTAVVVLQPADPKPAAVTFKPVAGSVPVELKSKGAFDMCGPDGASVRLVMDVHCRLTEATRKASAQEMLVNLGIDQFEMSRSIDGKALKPEGRLQSIAQYFGKMNIQLRVNPRGGIDKGQANLSGVPLNCRPALAQFSDELQQTLDIAAVEVPAGTLQPNQGWNGRRRLDLETYLFGAQALADMTYKYMGIRQVDQQTAAVINLNGVLSPLDPDARFTGKVRGSVSMDVATGRVLRGEATTDATLEIRTNEGMLRGTGTYTITISRGPGK